MKSECKNHDDTISGLHARIGRRASRAFVVMLFTAMIGLIGVLWDYTREEVNLAAQERKEIRKELLSKAEFEQFEKRIIDAIERIGK